MRKLIEIDSTVKIKKLTFRELKREAEPHTKHLWGKRFHCCKFSNLCKECNGRYCPVLKVCNKPFRLLSDYGLKALLSKQWATSILLKIKVIELFDICFIVICFFKEYPHCQF